jgi:hypothetical protein
MRPALIALFILLGAVPVAAQTPAPDQVAETDDLLGLDSNIPVFEAKKFARLQTLDKLTARTSEVTVPVGKSVAVGPLFMDVKTCQKTPPTELPESAAFIQVWEAAPKPKAKRKNEKQDDMPPSQWVFSGWMFASSPALSAMNHPIYDVWLKDCVDAPVKNAKKTAK